MKDERMQKAQLQEYACLRNELLFALRSRVWGTATYAVLCAGAFSLTGGPIGTIIWLVPPFLALPLLLYTFYVERQRIRISAYIATIIEPETRGLRYETYLERWRRRLPGKKTGEDSRPPDSVVDRSRYIFALLGIPYIISAFCLVMVLLSMPILPALLLVVSVCLLLCAVHIQISQLLSRKQYENDCQRFREIHAEIDG